MARFNGCRQRGQIYRERVRGVDGASFVHRQMQKGKYLIALKV